MHTTGRICPVCKKVIYGSSLYKAKTKKFCSWECFRKNNVLIHSVKKFCICGKQIQGRTSYEIKNKQFCSQKCKRKNYLHSEKIRQKIRQNRGEVILTPEGRKRISESSKGNKRALGHKLSQKHIEAIRKAQTGEKSHFWKDGIYNRNPYERNLYHVRKRRITKLGIKGSHSQEEWEFLKEKCNYICLHCGRKEPGIKLTEDHIIPISKNGSDNIENIQPLCKSCNCKKHNKLPSESKSSI
ncbi:MAG: HNH endonuclease signature motif containing protein [Nanoarchaeota archaeon]